MKPLKAEPDKWVERVGWTRTQRLLACCWTCDEELENREEIQEHLDKKHSVGQEWL
jgi:hypothetical protein